MGFAPLNPSYGPPAAGYFGPAKYQMIKPTTGRISISRTQSTFAPVDAPLCTTFTIAQMSSTRTMRPSTRFYGRLTRDSTLG
jgi:hypothetical protein